MQERMPRPKLPIDAVIPELLAALSEAGRLVLQAPPGAGKTTAVPIALVDAGLYGGKIIMLEPRRLAARAAAHRLAELLGEDLGRNVGYRMRGDSRPGAKIEVVTEAVLTRMIQSDPALDGISCVIFDEFHERALQADLGLALCLELRGALRPDLHLIVMSATLDAAPVAALLDDAPIVTAQGRSFPVTRHFLARPWQDAQKSQRLAQAMANLILRACEEQEGSVLAFLPGQAEIRQVREALGHRPGCPVLPLFGAMDFKEQRRAIAPGPERRVVLATSIAETALTIEGITCVVDCGLARRAAFDRGSGMSRLITQRVSQAEATQREGRAGRLAPGHCYKLWTKGENGGMRDFAPPEILRSDLSGLALEMAAWGSADLAFLTPPRAADLDAARALLRALGALDKKDQITGLGRKILAQPTHPRLGKLLVAAGNSADLAALLAAHDPFAGMGVSVDISHRLDALAATKQGQNPGISGPAGPRLRQIITEAKRLRATGPDQPLGMQAAIAYPDRIAKRRETGEGRFLLANGTGAVLDKNDPLAKAEMIVVLDTDGAPKEPRIRLATPIARDALVAGFEDQITTGTRCEWDERHGRLEQSIETRLGAIVLRRQHWAACPQQEAQDALIAAVAKSELALLDMARADVLRARAGLVAATLSEGQTHNGVTKADLDLSDAALIAGLAHWLGPYLSGVTHRAGLRAIRVDQALEAALGFAARRLLDHSAPVSFRAPTGTRCQIDYRAEFPTISVRIQELFGVDKHPCVGGKPLRIALLSPAMRPIQTTLDLPQFWRGSYADLRKDMRGRYPKHPWPEDPQNANPTRRTKAKGG